MFVWVINYWNLITACFRTSSLIESLNHWIADLADQNFQQGTRHRQPIVTENETSEIVKWLESNSRNCDVRSAIASYPTFTFTSNIRENVNYSLLLSTDESMQLILIIVTPRCCRLSHISTSSQCRSVTSPSKYWASASKRTPVLHTLIVSAKWML